MKIEGICTREPICIEPGASLDQAIDRMDKAGVRHLPVVDEGRLLGIVSNRDVLAATGWLPARMRVRYQDRDEVEGKVVSDLMHSPMMVASLNDDVLAVAAEAVAQGVGCLPVLQDGQLAGIVTEHDLLRAFLKLDRPATQPVASFMTSEVRTIPSDMVLGDARLEMDKHRLRHLPVVGPGGLVGILSDRDLRREYGRGREPGFPVRDAMTREPVWIEPAAPLTEAARTMVERHIDALPVVDGSGSLVGILTTIDVLDPCVRALDAPAP